MTLVRSNDDTLEIQWLNGRKNNETFYKRIIIEKDDGPYQQKIDNENKLCLDASYGSK